MRDGQVISSVFVFAFRGNAPFSPFSRSSCAVSAPPSPSSRNGRFVRGGNANCGELRRRAAAKRRRTSPSRQLREAALLRMELLQRSRAPVGDRVAEASPAVAASAQSNKRRRSRARLCARRVGDSYKFNTESKAVEAWHRIRRPTIPLARHRLTGFPVFSDSFCFLSFSWGNCAG